MVENPTRVIGPEQLLKSCPEIFIVPIEDRSFPNWLFPYFLSLFNPVLYKQNDEILRVVRQIHRAFSLPFEYSITSTAYPVTSVNPNKVIQIMEELSSAQPIGKTITDRVDQPMAVPIQLEEATYYIGKRLSNLSQAICLVSPTHLIDLPLIQSLKEHGVRPEEVGIIVLDQHFDAQTNLDNNGKLTPAKTNFLLHLLDIGIGGISLFGIKDDHIKRFRTGVMNANPNGAKHSGDDLVKLLKEKGIDDDSILITVTKGTDELHKVYKKYNDRVFFGDGYFVFRRRIINNPGKLITAVKEQVSLLKSKGIKYVLMSVDMDSLNLFKEQITAVSYNPYTILLSLGLQDLNIALQMHNVDINWLKQQAKTLTSLRKEIYALETIKSRKGALSPKESHMSEHKKKELLDLFSQTYPITYDLLNSTSRIDFPTGRAAELIGLPTIQCEEDGFSLKEIELIIRAVKGACHDNHLEFGVPMGQGKISGTISELEGIDLHGNTADAVLRISQALNSDSL